MVWCPGWKPCKTPLDFYECRHGMGYTRITGRKNQVEASVLFFVPLKTWAEVQKLTLTNQSQEVKTLKLFSFEEWCLWNAATDMENFQRNFSTGEVEIEGAPLSSPEGDTNVQQSNEAPSGAVGGASVVFISAVTGFGLDELKDVLWAEMNAESNKLTAITTSESLAHRDKDMTRFQAELADEGEDEDIEFIDAEDIEDIDDFEYEEEE